MKGIVDKRSGLAKALGGGPVPVRVLDGLGGRLAGVSVGVRALPIGEVQRATADAITYLTGSDCGFKEEHLYTELGEGVLDAETKLQILVRALVSPEEPTERLVGSSDELRALLEPDEVTALFNEFVAWQEERSPISRARSWEEVEDFLEALGKGRVPPTRLKNFDSSSLRFMLSELAVRHWRPTSPPCSDTSPSSDGDPSSA